MNKELKSKIKLISEMMSIYQTTVVNETDYENIQLIKKDITNKKTELEAAKKQLNFELNKLYDNGANEIDPEINQTQIIINDVDDLLDDVIPDILTYVNSPKFEKKPYNMFDNAIENTSVKKIKVNIESKEKNDNNFINVEPIKNENEIKLIKVGDINETHKQEKAENPKIEIKFETKNKDINQNTILQPIVKKEIIQTNELNINNSFKETVKPINNTINNNISEKAIKVKDIVDNDVNQPKVVKADKTDDVNVQIKKVPSFINTIKIKQPTQDYRNSATSIVTNRIKKVSSPENAIEKAYNAAEVVMNNIMETLKDKND